jgi:hypothetical protein
MTVHSSDAVCHGSSTAAIDVIDAKNILYATAPSQRRRIINNRSNGVANRFTRSAEISAVAFKSEISCR